MAPKAPRRRLNRSSQSRPGGHRMARPSTNGSIDEILRTAMEPVLKRASAQIAKALAEAAAERIDGELQRGLARVRGRGGGRAAAGRSARPARQRAEITRWVADRR